MMQPLRNKSILVTSPQSDQLTLVVAIILDMDNLDLEHILANVVMEMASHNVRAGLLFIGDSTLILRNTDTEISVDEVDTSELMALAGLKNCVNAERLVVQVQQWIAIMANRKTWQGDLLGPYRTVLMPEVMSGLVGNIEARDGIWGVSGYRTPSPIGPQ